MNNEIFDYLDNFSTIFDYLDNFSLAYAGTASVEPSFAAHKEVSAEDALVSNMSKLFLEDNN